MHKPGEIRIGLVLYGGVSLAVYINGVAQEFFRAVRGDGIYALLKALLGADIVVDVISGTSAGGLNGIYLAYALCQEKQPANFLQFSELWRKHGDIDKLLRSPRDPSPDSLLDGEGYYRRKLEGAFLDMGAWQSASEAPSELSELDLFITGTDFHGFVYTRFDGTGRPITVKDHRTLFQLKFRRGRYNDFAASGDITPEELHGELAKLARITSCFPVAFPPVKVGKDDRLKDDPLKGDRLIRKWGQLTRKPLMPGQTEEPPRYYLDGGVLDNKPFTSTIQAIFHRTAARPVTRKLFYVEPIPEVFEPGVADASPNVVEAGVGALTGIPGYESIAGDLQAIRERNTQIQRFRNLAEVLTPGPGSTQDSQASPEQRDLYRRSRLHVLLDRVLIGLLRQSGHEVLLNADEQRLASRLFAEFFRTFDPATQDQVLGDFDTDARMRRLFYVTYALEATSASVAEDALATDTCNRWIKCLEVLRFALESAVDQLPLRWYDDRPDGPRLRPPAEVWGETGMALAYVLAADAEVTAFLDGPPDQEAATRLCDILLGRIKKLKGKDVAPPAPAPTLLRHLDEQFEKAGFLEGSPAAREAWRCFPRIDLHRYPLQAASGIFEMDFIDTVRISPKDAQLGFSRKERPSDKLSGDQMANFGGFFKRSWRSNDVLWGRLDGLARIFETLLSREAVEAATADPAGADERRGVIRSMKLPPDLDAWLQDLADPRRPEKHGDALAALDAGAAQQKGGKLDRLVRHAQSDLVEEGLKAVAEDSIKEQIEWNRCRTGDPGRTKFHLDDLRFTRPNSGFISLAAQRMALDALERGEIPDLGTFFEKQYAVGEETLAEDVPRPVLAELASRAALVLRNCLAPAGDAATAGIRKSPLFKAGFDWPVRGAHGFAQMVRYAPTTARVVTWLAAIYAVAALLAGFKWWKFFIWPQQGLQVSALALMIVVPLVILGALPEMLDWQYPGSKGVARRYAPWALLALVAGLAVGGVVWLAELRTGLEEFVASKSGPVSSGLLAGCAVVAGAILLRVFRWALSLLRKRAALGSDPSLDRQGSEE